MLSSQGPLTVPGHGQSTWGPFAFPEANGRGSVAVSCITRAPLIRPGPPKVIYLLSNSDTSHENPPLHKQNPFCHITRYSRRTDIHCISHVLSGRGTAPQGKESWGLPQISSPFVSFQSDSRNSIFVLQCVDSLWK